MIGRIGLKSPHVSSASFPTDPPRAGKGPAFHSLLEERLDPSKPLEMITIQLLKQAIEAVLSMDPYPREREPLFFSSLPFNAPGQPSSVSYSPPQTIRPGAPEASKNLRLDRNFDPIVEEAARAYDVDPRLIRAVIEVESGGNPHAVSPAGAQGLMQLMPKTGAELGMKNPFDPAQNITAGTRYLRQLIDRYQGNVRLALAAYNWGMGNLEKRPEAMPRETQRYIAKVENLYNSHKEPLEIV